VVGVRVTVRTDHASLAWLRNFKAPEGQLARWLERLAEFDIDLIYRKGSAAANADGLSRRPCPPDCSYCNKRQEKDNKALVNVILADQEWDWSKEQEADDILKIVKGWVVSEAKTPWEDVSSETPALKSFWAQYETLKAVGGILVRKFFLPFGNTVDQIVVPTHLIASVIKIVHEEGHFGRKRTQEAISSRFYCFK
jgi:hypothetical protein